MPEWVDREFTGEDFRDFDDGDLTRLHTERVVFTECDFSGVDLAVLGGNDLRGASVDASLWTTASLTGARVDVPQAMAFALAHGLRLDGDPDAAGYR